MKFSIIIATCNRPRNIVVVLKSILRQVTLPKEVIIVDQSDYLTTKILVDEIRSDFSRRKIKLKYIHSKEKSSAGARNLGLRYASGQIVFFLDDDIILDKDYTKEILDVYKENSDAIGVQGINVMHPLFVTPTWDPFHAKKPSLVRHIINSAWKVFFLSHTQKNKWVVLPSVSDVFPIPLTKVISSQRLEGCTSYKHEVFQRFLFDEKLKRWSFLEDFDLSYQVYNSKVGKLYVTPHARLLHKRSETRLPEKTEIFIMTVYRTYIFYKDIEQTVLNQLIFIWSMIGSLFKALGHSMIAKTSKEVRWKPIYMLESYAYTLKHLKSIRQTNLSFFDKILNARTL